MLAGELRSTARACRLVDDRTGAYRELLGELYPHAGKAWLVGVTGTPGAGKSTLVDRLVGALRSEALKVAVVAVDPTSPFSGGAILGDRIRMQRHFDDPGVFIRSVATRGALGGLSRSAADIARVLEAWGANVVLIETVGVGQDEIEVTRAAHTTLVVAAPGLGDEVQAQKAGLLECADVFAVNKADREGADATVRDLELMIALGGELLSAGSHSHAHAAGKLDVAQQDLRHDAGRWVPQVLKCVATRNEGTAELLLALRAHHAWLLGTEAGRARRAARLREQLVTFLREALTDAASSELGAAVDEAVLRVEAHEIDPYAACDALVERFRRGA